jgi:hypothetical protein
MAGGGLEIADGEERRKALGHGFLQVRRANRSYEKRSFVGKPAIPQVPLIGTAAIPLVFGVVDGLRGKPGICEEW